MLTGHANVQAVRSHFPTAAGLIALILDASSLIDEIEVQRLLDVHSSLLKGSCPTSSVIEEDGIQKLNDVLDATTKNLSGEIRIGKLYLSSTSPRFRFH